MTVYKSIICDFRGHAYMYTCICDAYCKYIVIIGLFSCIHIRTPVFGQFREVDSHNKPCHTNSKIKYRKLIKFMAYLETSVQWTMFAASKSPKTHICTLAFADGALCRFHRRLQRVAEGHLNPDSANFSYCDHIKINN